MAWEIAETLIAGKAVPVTANAKTFSHSVSLNVPSCHHIEKFDVFVIFVYESCSAIPRNSPVAALKTFNYSALSSDHQAQLRRFVSEIHKCGCQQTPAAVEIGNMLVQAKKGLHHGMFEKWCKSEAGYSKRRVELFMSLANFAGKQPDVFRIPVSAGYRLAAPSAPEHIIEQVLSVARAGERVTVSWVEKLLRKSNKKESKPERGSTSEITKIAKLIANALEPGQATTLRKVLEAVGPALTKRFVSDLQSQLQATMHDTSATRSFDQRAHEQGVTP